MNRSIAIMEEEHSNINRALAVVRKICLQLMDGAEVPDSDLRQIIDFIRGYAEKMGPVADKLVTHGMLVEHDLGRADVLALETALNEYQKTPTPELKLDILSYAMAYAHLLQLHIEKENSVVYPFAERSLSTEDFQVINDKSEVYEAEKKKEGVQDKYLNALEILEKKYLH